MFDDATHKACRAFYGFEYDVAHKAVGNHDVYFIAVYLVGFDVADEIDGALLEQLKGLLNGFGAFDVFRADVEQADFGGVVAGIQGTVEFVAHDGELVELLGGAVDVCAEVKHQGELVVFSGEKFGNGGAVYMGQGFEHEAGGCHQRACVACGNGGLGVALFHLLDGNAHG